MTDLSEIYKLKAPYRLNIVPIGVPVEISIHSASLSRTGELIAPLAWMPRETIAVDNLRTPILGTGNHVGTITVFKNDWINHNQKTYEQSYECFDNPQQMILAHVRKSCKELYFYKDEIINCNTLFSLIKAVSELIISGLMLKELRINDVVFNVENMKLRTGEGVQGNPLVNSNGVVRRTVKMSDSNGGYNNVYYIRHDQAAQHYQQTMILFDDFLLVDDEPIPKDELTLCPACGSHLVVCDGEYNCIEKYCDPFLEAFLNSIARQTGIAVETLRGQHRNEEKFHYDTQSTIEEQAREEIPVDCIRTYFDILKLDGLAGIMERFYGVHNQQLYCSRSVDIDNLFDKYLTYSKTESCQFTRPVVYFPPNNIRARVLTLGTFDGISEQTLELKLADLDIAMTNIVQDADIVIAGKVQDDEFFEYVKEVSNILIIETQGNIHDVFRLIQYF